MYRKARKFTKSQRPGVTRGSSAAGLAIKTGYLVLAAMALVFVVMLALTVMHP
jgi:hypothetical protein